MEKNLKKREIKNMEEFYEQILEAWNEIEIDTCNHLVDSMEDRIIDLYEANGGYTKY